MVSTFGICRYFRQWNDHPACLLIVLQRGRLATALLN